MRDWTLNKVQLSPENTAVFISQPTKAYRWMWPTNICAHRAPGEKKKKKQLWWFQKVTYSFNTLNLCRILRDLWKGTTRCNRAVALFSDLFVAVGPALLSKRLYSLCIYITSKVFIHNQEHAKSSKWKVSEISHLSRWLRLIQIYLFWKIPPSSISKTVPMALREKEQREKPLWGAPLSI